MLPTNNRQCRSRNCDLLTSQEDILTLWDEYSIKSRASAENRQPNGQELKQEERTPPTLEEVKQAILKPVKNKSPRTDNLPELFKIVV